MMDQVEGVARQEAAVATINLAQAHQVVARLNLTIPIALLVQITRIMEGLRI